MYWLKFYIEKIKISYPIYGLSGIRWWTNRFPFSIWWIKSICIHLIFKEFFHFFPSLTCLEGHSVCTVHCAAAAVHLTSFFTHYSTCTNPLTLFEKSNFCPKNQFWQNPNIFTSFSPKIVLTIFLVKSKLSTAKKSKTTTFSRVFQPQKTPTIFSGNQSWIFGQKMKISNSVYVTVILIDIVLFRFRMKQINWVHNP